MRLKRRSKIVDELVVYKVSVWEVKMVFNGNEWY